MGYLIDTHIFLWLIFDPNKINPKVLKLIGQSDTKIFLSAISIWEIAIKFSKGNLDLKGLTPSALLETREAGYLTKIPLSIEDVKGFDNLSIIENHKDPFDRILIWQAIKNNLTIITKDKIFAKYEQFGLQLILS